MSFLSMSANKTRGSFKTSYKKIYAWPSKLLSAFFPYLSIQIKVDYSISVNVWYASMNRVLFISSIYFCFIVSYLLEIRIFLSTTVPFHSRWRFTGQHEKGVDLLLFFSITSTRSQTFRHLFATLHVTWLPRTFNRIACNYQTATRWDLPPYSMSIWWIDNGMLVSLCLATWWFDCMFLLKHSDMETGEFELASTSALVTLSYDLGEMLVK